MELTQEAKLAGVLRAHPVKSARTVKAPTLPVAEHPARFLNFTCLV